MSQAEIATRSEAEIALKTPEGLMPALSFNQMASRYNAMKQMAQEIMRKDADYGVIPGIGTKPTLLKPGAEKLCALFGLRPVFVIVREIEDWDKGVFYYWYKCQLYSGDRLIGEGEGSANSKEKKYRWRTVYENKATAEEKRIGKLETRPARGGGSYKVYIIENTEPFDLINTLQKMAQKRALVAATLIATSASDFFTQDVEDMVDVEFRPVADVDPVDALAIGSKRADDLRKKLDDLGLTYPDEDAFMKSLEFKTQAMRFEELTDKEVKPLWEAIQRHVSAFQREQGEDASKEAVAS